MLSLKKFVVSAAVTAMCVCFVHLQANAANPTFSNGAVATPPTVNVPNPNPTVSVIPDTLTLVTGTNAGNWNTALTATLQAQGFTSANNWLYSFSPPAPLTNPVSLGSTSGFNVTQYSLVVNPALPGGTIAERIRFNLTLGNTIAPAGSTIHWLSLLNENKQYPSNSGNGPFGYKINGLNGYWQLDNNDLAGSKTVGPYYDFFNWFPPTFGDTPGVGTATPGTYLHFLTIPTWNVLQGGKNYILVGNQAISWGYTVVPESSTLWLFVGGCVLLLRCRRRVA